MRVCETDYPISPYIPENQNHPLTKTSLKRNQGVEVIQRKSRIESSDVDKDSDTDMYMYRFAFIYTK